MFSRLPSLGIGAAATALVRQRRGGGDYPMRAAVVSGWIFMEKPRVSRSGQAAARLRRRGGSCEPKAWEA